MSNKELKTKVRIGTKANPVRFSYCHVWKPKAMNEGDTPKYSVCLLIDKTDKAMVKAVKECIENAAKKAKDKLGDVNFKKLPRSFWYPLRDGDEERPDDEAYSGMYFLNCNTMRKPQIVDEDVEEILSQDEFYSGCYGRATVNFYGFSKSGNKGVAAGLGNLQKLKDGEAMAGGSSAADDFGDDEDDDLL